MDKLTDVKCTYTGGGIYVCTAKFNDEVWICTDFDDYGTYDMPWEVITDQLFCNYEAHWKKPSIPLPTWGDILKAIRESYETGDSPNMDMLEVEHQIITRHPQLFRKIDEDECSLREDDGNSKRLEILSLFIEQFEEFLDDRNIDIPNEEKAQDPNASIIYGSDYGELSDRIESLLIRLGMM